MGQSEGIRPLHETEPQDTALFVNNEHQYNGNRSRYCIPRSPWSVVAADIELDGDNDIISGHKFSSQTDWGGISLLNNTGTGYFILSDSLFVNHGFPYLNLNYFNNNEFIDLYGVKVTDNPYTVYISVFFDYALYNFNNESTTTLTRNDPVNLCKSGDVNNDDNIDIVFASNNGQYWSVMYNTGNGNFLQPEYHNVVGYYPSALACGDLNEDEWDDVVVCGQSTEVYFSYPDGFESLLLEEFDSKTEAFIIDFDLDGDNDLLTFVGIQIINISALKFYKNLGGGILDTFGIFYFHALSSKSFLSDFNNDSLPDVLFQLSDKSGYVIYYNQGGFQLDDSSYISLPSYEYEAWRNNYCDDMDGNGYNDIITIRTSNAALPDNLVVLYNDGDGNFGEDPITDLNNSNKVNNLNSLYCYPSPFSTETTFQIYQTDNNSVLKFQIFNLQGVLINSWNVSNKNSRKNVTIKWDGNDKAGKQCKPGIYVALVNTNDKVTQQIKILKHN